MRFWDFIDLKARSAAATVASGFVALYPKGIKLYMRAGSNTEEELLTLPTNTSVNTGDVLQYNGSRFSPSSSSLMKRQTINVSSNASYTLSNFDITVIYCSSSSNLSVTINVSNLSIGSVVFVKYTSPSVEHRRCTITIAGMAFSQNVILSKSGSNTALGAKYQTEAMIIKGIDECQIIYKEKTY